MQVGVLASCRLLKNYRQKKYNIAKFHSGLRKTPGGLKGERSTTRRSLPTIVKRIKLTNLLAFSLALSQLSAVQEVMSFNSPFSMIVILRERMSSLVSAKVKLLTVLHILR